MDIVRFTTSASTEPKVGISDGEAVTELGAATLAELLRQPAAQIRRRCQNTGLTNPTHQLKDASSATWSSTCTVRTCSRTA